jgi:hypothetical protein
MVEQSRETPATNRSGEAVETKLLRIGAFYQNPNDCLGSRVR